MAVPPQALVALRAHLDRWTEPGDDAWVFTGARVAHCATPCGNTSGIARRSVGLSGLHFHDLRHVAATLTAATGAGVKEIIIGSGTRRPRPPSATSTPRRSERPGHRRGHLPSSSKQLPANEAQGYSERVADKVWTAQELAGMTPAERHAIFESSLVFSLDGIPPALLDRVRSRVQERIADADIREG